MEQVNRHRPDLSKRGFKLVGSTDTCDTWQTTKHAVYLFINVYDYDYPVHSVEGLASNRRQTFVVNDSKGTHPAMPMSMLDDFIKEWNGQ